MAGISFASVSARRLVLVVGLLTAFASLAFADTGSANLVVSPEDGARLHGPSRVVVKVDRGTVTARLNGKRVEREFLRTAPRRRSVRIGAAEGLKPGSNHLSVKRKTPRGTQTERIVLNVAARGKLAGVRARGDHVAGAALSLRAYGEKKRNWCLLDAPRESELDESSSCPKPRSGGSGHPKGIPAPAESGFDDTDAQRTTFTPDVAGSYRVALASGTGPQATQDVYTVTAAPPSPLIPLDVPTLNYYGEGPEEQKGIQVGDAGYWPTPEAVDPQIQVVLLDRTSLTPEPLANPEGTCADTKYQAPGGCANLAYSCGESTPGGCDVAVANKLSADLSRVLDSTLVFVSFLGYSLPAATQPTENSTGPQTLQALAKIGFDPAVAFPDTEGVAAIIGIPGSLKGDAWALREADPNFTTHTPHMTGSLAQDQFGNYRPVPADHRELVVRSSSGMTTNCAPQPCGTTATSNTMKIGNEAQTDSLPAGAQGGFQIVLLDGVSGAVRDHEVAVSNPSSSSTMQAAVNSVDAQIKAGDPGVVLVASIGEPVGDPTKNPNDWNAFAGFIESQGGTKHAVLSMAAGETYAMAGETGSGAAGGTEVGPAVVTPQFGASTAPVAGTTALAGGLGRDDNDWRFSPRVGGELSAPNVEMAQAVYQPATPWPTFNADAMQCISEALWPGLGITDAHQAYWTQSSWDATRWNTYRAQLSPDAPDAITYAGIQKLPDAKCSSPAFSATEFTSLSNQLYDEFGSVALVKDSIAAYQAPITAVNTGQSDTPSIAQQVASAIQNGVQPSQGTQITLRQFTDVMLTIGSIAVPQLDEANAEELEKVGKALSGLKSAIDFASDHASALQSGSPTPDSFQSTVSQFGTGMNDSLETISDGFGSLTPIILSDPKKLDAFAKQFQPPDADETEAGLRLWIRQQAWEAMLPAKFNTGVAWYGNYPVSQGTDATNYDCYTGTTWSGGEVPVEQPGSYFKPFAKLPAGGQVKLRVGYGANGPIEDIWAIGDWNRSNNVFQDQKLPAASITEELFSPLDPDPISNTTNPNNFLAGNGHGMGFIPAQFIAEHYPSPYNALAENPGSSDAFGYCKF